MMLVSGTLADLDVAGIAAMTSLGRSSLRLELRRSSGDLIGSMVLKAGRVVSATAGGVRGRDALRVILGSASDTRFQLAHEPLDFMLSSELARGAIESDAGPRPAPAAPARIAMMQGPLDEFDLVALLQTIGVGRQLVEVEVRDRAGMALGAVRVKSGKLVAAHAGGVTGVDAVAALRGAADGVEFAAYRVAAAPPPLRELAGVAELGTRPPRADRVVMEGSLADFDLPTVLHTIGCSRQYCALEIGDERALCGTIGVKAGVVVAANAGPLTGLPAVQQLIAGPRGRRFRLIQRAAELPDQVPLGPVGQVLLHADAPAPTVRPPPAPRPPASGAAAPAPDDRAAAGHAEALVLEGRLADFDVRTVLEVLAATRQHARLEIFDPGQPPLGEVVLKAGWILSSQAGALRGTEALAVLLAASPRLQFRVLTAAEPVAGGAPLGQVHDVLVGLSAPRAADREASTRVLRWAIPISFALGGTIVFLVSRGGTTTRPVGLPDARHAPPVHAAPPAEAKSAEPGPTTAPPVPAPPDDASLPADQAVRTITTAQIALTQLGFEPGPVDGVLGRRTRRAILRFQRAHQLRATGALDPETWSAIAAQLMARRAQP
jgi:putative peptidoglycan binding protein